MDKLKQLKSAILTNLKFQTLHKCTSVELIKDSIVITLKKRYKETDYIDTIEVPINLVDDLIRSIEESNKKEKFNHRLKRV